MYLVPNIHPGSGSAGVPTVQANFAGSPADWTTLDTVSSMPTGGSISRAGQGMLYDSTGRLTYAPNNLLVQSNTFTTTWTKSTLATVAITGATTDPTGGSNAYKLYENSTTAGTHDVRQTSGITLVSGVNYITSLYVKAAERTQVCIEYYDGTNDKYPIFNIPASAGGAVTKAVDNGIGSNWSYSDAGNGWYRISILTTASNTGGQVYIYPALSDSYTYAGTVNSGIYIYGAQLEAVTYQTTPSAYVATTSAAYYGPRFDYDPSTLAAKGLLIEGTRTNLLTYSNTFTIWTAYGTATLTANAATAPDGTNTATLFGSALNNGIYQGPITISASNQYTITVYAKAGTTSNIRISYVFTGGAGANGFSDFAISSGTSVGNGWYRIKYTFTPGVGDTALQVRIQSADATANIYIFGAQLEAGAFATSYIPTVASSTARAAETFAITGYSSNLINATYIDEQTGNTYQQPYNAGVAPSPSFAWLTALRVYTNAYAGNIATPSWLSFSRTGNATMMDSTGKLVWAAANMFTYSQQFDNAAWTKASGTVTADTTVAPDGTTTADTFAVAANGQFYQVLTGDGNRYTFSIYAKAGTVSSIKLYLSTTGVGLGASVAFDLSAGTAGTVTNYGTTTGSVAAITSAGSGWYRCSITVTSTAATYYAQASVESAGNAIFWGAQLQPVTYQTAPSAYIPTTTAAVYNPRYDFDASTVPATPRGLLIEESRTNLATYSNSLSNAAWDLVNAVTTTADATIAPDGTQTAALYAADTTNADHYRGVSGGVTFSAGANTVSIYMKSAGQRYARINFYANIGTFDLQAGTASGTGATITSVGNGWYRCAVTATMTAGARYFVFAVGNGVYTGDGVTGIYVWGAQAELGAFATSLIPTTSASVTRAADVAQLTGSALTAVGGTSASAIAEVAGVPTSSGQIIASNLNTLLGKNGSTTNSVYTYDAKSGGTVLVAALGSGLNTSTFRSAVAYDASSISLVANNGTVATDTATFAGAPITTARIGGRSDGYYINSYVRSLALYNQRLPDAILKQKSSVGAPY